MKRWIPQNREVLILSAIVWFGFVIALVSLFPAAARP